MIVSPLRDVRASARRLIDESREMVAWSIARMIATNPYLSPGTVRRTGPELLLKLLDSPCDLDVLTFAQRHPRALLTIDDIARAVGRDADAVRVSIEALTVAGLVAPVKIRCEAPDVGVLFYEFSPGSWDAILAALCWVTASAEGRRVLRDALLRRRILGGAVAGRLQ
jgi:hypothetical protein